MLAGSLSFAFMSTLAHALRDYCDWQVVAIARTALVLVFGILLALSAGVKLVWLRPRTLWMRSLAGSVSLVCTFYALPRLNVSDLLTLTNTFPIWVAVLSWPMLRELPSPGVCLAVACAAADVWLIQQPHLEAGNFATVVALVSGLFTAVAMIGLHRLQRIDVRAVVVHFSAVGLLACLAATLFSVDSLRLPDLADSKPLLMLLGVGGTATLGQLLLTRAFTSGPPAKISVIGLTQIVFAMGLEIVVDGRSFNTATLLGMALVIAPSAWLMLHRHEARADVGPLPFAGYPGDVP